MPPASRHSTGAAGRPGLRLGTRALAAFLAALASLAPAAPVFAQPREAPARFGLWTFKRVSTGSGTSCVIEQPAGAFDSTTMSIGGAAGRAPISLVLANDRWDLASGTYPLLITMNGSDRRSPATGRSVHPRALVVNFATTRQGMREFMAAQRGKTVSLWVNDGQPLGVRNLLGSFRVDADFAAGFARVESCLGPAAS